MSFDRKLLQADELCLLVEFVCTLIMMHSLALAGGLI